MNRIGGSHYATEAFVLRDDMVRFFTEMGVPAEFAFQPGAWR